MLLGVRFVDLLSELMARQSTRSMAEGPWAPLFKALIEEIKIQSDDSLVPVFRIPMSGPQTNEPALDGPAHVQSGRDSVVRTLPPMVGDTGIESLSLER